MLRDGDIAYAIESAKDLLAQYDYVVLKAKSYRAAQQRQAIAQAEAKWERQEAESTRRWARTTLHNEIRDLMARCTFLYGMARAKGATVDELKGGWTVVGANLPLEKTSTIQCQSCGVHPYVIYDEDSRPITRFICPTHGVVTRNG
jgi:hypothetical protein